VGALSALVVPLVAGERISGTITLGTTRGSGRRLNEVDLELAEELGRRAGVAIENARVHGERVLIASTLQDALLPPRLPEIPGVSIAACFRAAGEASRVGGDFYDVFAVPGGWMAIMGDVTGKGAAAAAVTALARRRWSPRRPARTPTRPPHGSTARCATSSPASSATTWRCSCCRRQAARPAPRARPRSSARRGARRRPSCGRSAPRPRGRARSP